MNRCHGVSKDADHFTNPPAFCAMLADDSGPETLDKASDGKNSPGPSELYEVRIIDNDFNTYQQVIDVSMLALGISEDEAFAIAWEVDHSGYCVVAHGPYDQAEAVAATIRTIGIEVRVNLVEAPIN